MKAPPWPWHLLGSEPQMPWQGLNLTYCHCPQSTPRESRIDARGQHEAWIQLSSYHGRRGTLSACTMITKTSLSMEDGVEKLERVKKVIVHVTIFWSRQPVNIKCHQGWCRECRRVGKVSRN